MKTMTPAERFSERRSRPLRIAIAWTLTLLTLSTWADEPIFSSHDAQGLGPDAGVMRRDPSDIIQVGETYYVWYSRGPVSHGYDATIWYAESTDGRSWRERGEALARGDTGSWDEQSVFTPNILVAEGRYWLFYTAVAKPFVNTTSKTAIGIAWAESPRGPWTRTEGNPVVSASSDVSLFDSMRVDDACLIVRDGRYWLYFKGRQMNRSWMETKLGVAIADKPEGPYVKHPGNPLVGGGHEVMVWPFRQGVLSLINIGPEGIGRTLQYSDDGLRFSRVCDLDSKTIPFAAGFFRPEAFKDRGRGEMVEWGIETARRDGQLPYLRRVDCIWPELTLP